MNTNNENVLLANSLQDGYYNLWNTSFTKCQNTFNNIRANLGTVPTACYVLFVFVMFWFCFALFFFCCCFFFVCLSVFVCFFIHFITEVNILIFKVLFSPKNVIEGLVFLLYTFSLK